MSDITISDIHCATGVSRSTFYRLFDTPEDVLLYLCDQFKKEMSDAFKTQTLTDIKELFTLPVNHSLQNYVLINALVNNLRLNLLGDLYSVACQHMLEWMAPYGQSDEVTNSYVTAQLYAAVTAMFSTWIIHGRRETPAQLAEYMKEYSQVASAIAKHF